MSEDDNRHGTVAGYSAFCRCDLCKHAMFRYRKQREHDALAGRPRTVPATPTIRRIRALVAIGWDFRRLSARLGRSQAYVRGLTIRPTVTTTTRDTINRLYDELCMTPGPSKRSRLYAQRNSWPPPLAWEDIDTDPEPYRPPLQVKHKRLHVDEVVILRALRGIKVDATPAERREVVRRWVRMDRSLAELAHIQQWRVDRYREAS